jgi:hypothetical protein
VSPVLFTGGLGVRTVAPDAFDATPFGLHAFGRADVGSHATVEGGVYARVPGQGVTRTAETLVDIALAGNPDTEFQQPVERELGSASFYAEASPWRHRWDGVVDVWPYALAGVEGMLRRTDDLRPDGEDIALARGTPGIVPAPAEGVGLDVWVRQRVGARLTFIAREWSGPEPDYGGGATRNELWWSVASSMDLVVRL